MVMVKVNSLKIDQLNKLLQNNGVVITGNKAAKVNKLLEIYGTDEVESDDLEETIDEDAMQQQMHELRQMLMDLTKTVTELATTQNAAKPDNTGDAQRATTPATERQVTATPRQATAILQRPASVHEISGILPTFDPLKGNINSEAFVQKVEQLQNIYGWSEKEILVAAQLNLKGVAKTWLDSQQVFQSWTEFVSNFMKDFPKTIMSAQVHREMAQRKRQPRETFEEFYYAMLSMGRRGKMDEESINSYIISGLNDNNLSRTLLAMKLPTCNDLLRSLEAMAVMSTQSSTRSSAPYDKGSADQTQKTTADKKPIKCYNCNEFGHISSKCTQPQRKPRCSKCNKSGHEAKACKVDKATIAEVQSEAKGVPNPVIKTVEWNGNRYKAFIDTGSDVSLIAQSKVPAGVQRTTSVKRLTGFGGAVISSTEAINAEIIVDGITILTTCQIVPDKFMTFDILMGRDVLCQNDYRLTIDAGVMQVHKKTGTSFNINEELPHEIVTKVGDLLNEYHDCFAEDLAKLGRCKTAEMDIVISTDQPVVGKRYQVPLSQRSTLTNIIDNLLKHGIIRCSSSVHAAPVILVQKSNGEDRMCVDYRALNAVTLKKHFPMPVVEEQLSKLAGNILFTSLDMTSGYYQIPLREESKPYTACLTPDGLFEHNVMPFGLRKSPMVFQEMVVKLIRNLKHRKRIISYVDEVVIATKSVDESIEVLAEFLQAVKAAGLTLRPSKCIFLATTIKFLGHVVDASGIKPGEEKVKCISEFPQPRTPTEVRQFLGLKGFFRKFVESYGVIARPLATLLRKGITFEWNSNHEKSFNKLKDALTTQPVLSMFDITKLHEVHTDASAIGLSGVMLQLESNGWKPVQYYSRQCSSVEAQYSSHELEVLAIVESLERFRMFLLGTHFVVRTDCNAVATTKSITSLRPRIARWWLRLQEFDFDCVHRSGTQMQHVDALSRAPVEPPSKPDTVAERVLQVTHMKCDDWVYAMQTQDPKLRQICEVLKAVKTVDASVCQQINVDYEIRNDRLFRKVGHEYKLVVPRAVRWRITKASHDDVGHFALEKTLARISKHFWFERMRRYVKSYIASCEECCFNKVKGGRKESQLHIADVLPIPFRHVYVDHVGPFPKSRSGFVYVLVIVCGFSKYVVLKPTRNTKTEPVVKALEEMTCIFGQPLKLTSDRGTAFTSAKFQAFVDKRGIQHVKTAVRTPRANGQAERVNKTLLQALKCTVEDNKNWDAHLTTIQWSLNSQKNEVTGYTPNELVFYFNPRDVTCNRLIQAIHDEVKDMSDLDMKRDTAADRIMTERNKWKERYDNKHKTPTQYEVGDLVVVDHAPSATGESHKLDPAYKGPYMISKVLNYDRYIVEDLPDVTVTQRRYSNVMSTDHIKPWCVSSPESDVDDDEDESSCEDEESGKAELSPTEIS